MKKLILFLMALGTVGYSAARITNADISTSAAIAWSKMAAQTVSRVMVSDSSGVITASSVSATSLGYIVNVTSDIQNQLNNKQSLDADLTALAALSSTGFLARTGSNTYAERTLTQPGAGLTISNSTGGGNPTFALANDLSALEGLGSTGFAVRSTTDTWVQRSLAAPAAGFTISNSDGVSGNPTFALADDLSALEALSGTNTIYYRSASNTWSAVSIGSGLGFTGGTLSNTSSPASAPRSYVSVSAGNGHGSTNNKVRRFTTTDVSTGSNITYADSAANGGSFTISADGVYSICYSDASSGGATQIGITVNGSALTTSIGSVTYAQGFRAITESSSANRFIQVCQTLFLSNGDVVRAHTDGSANDTTVKCNFRITQVNN